MLIKMNYRMTFMLRFRGENTQQYSVSGGEKGGNVDIDF